MSSFATNFCYKTSLSTAKIQAKQVNFWTVMASDNLVLRGGNWYVRLSVPVDVRPILNRREFIASLKTGSKQEAQALKLPFLQSWRAEITSARGIAAHSTEEQREQAYKASQAIEQYLNKSISLSALGKAKEANATSLNLAKELDSFGLDYEAFSLLFKKYRAREMGVADWVEFQKELTDILKTEVFQVINPTNPNEVKKILKDPSEYRSKSPLTLPRLNGFEDYQRNTKGIVNKTVDMQVSRLRKLKAWLEENKADLTHENIERYLDTLPFSVKTKKQHLFAGNSFWKYALRKDSQFKEQHKEQANPFEKHNFEENRGAKKNERKAFTVEDIRRLYEASKNQNLSDLIAMGAYTGARIEEICRLKIDDIVREDGIDCFYIKDGKTENAERIVPIHKTLKPIVKRLIKDSEDQFLIPVSGRNKYGNRSDSLGKQFGRLKKSLGYGPEFVFHSLRKSFITLLQNNDVPGLTIASIVGHETGTITFDVYSAGPNAKQKLKAISSLKII